ncbi:unnamed protein product [Cuscuta europaea]|uniref:CCHC-type domain-containing protein n=1 Tax=Cuscuta europaea TaxID=41803 RepID=A0A9P1E270_CUSEU|nr:unnamed protein product [Cuscuta europaea]
MPPRREVPAAPTNAELALTIQQLAQTIGTAFFQSQQNSNDASKRVAARNPPSFQGQEDPLILEYWIRTFDKLFEAVNCPAEQRVDIAAYYFHQEADNWWATDGPALRQQPNFTWEALKEAMRERFYPEHVKAEKYEEFLYLKQGAMSVQDYYAKFVALARFASALVPDENSKARKFINGLNYDTQKAVSVLGCQTLKEAYMKAATHYRVQQLQRLQRDAHKRNKRNGDDDHPQREKRARPKPPEQRIPRQVDHRNHGGRNFQGQGMRTDQRSQARERYYHCKLCQKNHRGVDCAGNPVKCYNCGRTGHRAFECHEGKEKRNRNQSQLNGGGDPGGNRPGGADNPNHNARGNVGNHKGNNNAPNQGKIFVMNQAQANACDVVSGGDHVDYDAAIFESAN